MLSDSAIGTMVEMETVSSRIVAVSRDLYIAISERSAALQAGNVWSAHWMRIRRHHHRRTCSLVLFDRHLLWFGFHSALLLLMKQEHLGAPQNLLVEMMLTARVILREACCADEDGSIAHEISSHEHNQAQELLLWDAPATSDTRASASASCLTMTHMPFFCCHTSAWQILSIR